MNPPTHPLDSTLRTLTNCDCCTGTQAQTPVLMLTYRFNPRPVIAHGATWASMAAGKQKPRFNPRPVIAHGATAASPCGSAAKVL